MLGQLLDGRYKIVRVLSAGGFGRTFVAEDTKRPGNPVCVVKQLKPASSDPAFLETARRMFQNEAETLEQLGEHAQIPRLLANFEQAQEFYLVQEYIDGHPLSHELRAGEKWTEPQVLDFLKQSLGILAFVHQNRVIHRDVKPNNIIRRRSDSKFVLVDFGAVKQVRTQTTTGQGLMSATIAIGTPGYMPSEQGIGKPKPSSDLYALGVIAIQALTGLSPAPHQDDTDTGFRYNSATGEILWQDKAQVSPSLAAVLTKMVKPHFPDRYATAAAVTQALEALDYTYTPTVHSQESLHRHTPTQVETNEESNPITRTIPVVNDNAKKATTIIQPKSSSKLVLIGAAIASLAIAVGLTNSPFKTKPPVANELYDQANKLYDSQRYQESLNLYQQALQLKPEYAEALSKQGYALYNLNRYPESLKAFEQALQLKPDDADALNGQGYVLDLSKRHQEAVASLNQALKIRPDFPEALNNRGNALINLRQYQEAIADFDRILALKPDFYRTWNSKSYALIRLQQFSEAIAAADKALALKSDFAAAWNNKGEAFEQLQQYPQAKEAYEKAVSFDSNFALAKTNLDRVLKKLTAQN